MREIKILETIKNGTNCINLLDVCYDNMSKTICLVGAVSAGLRIYLRKQLQRDISEDTRRRSEVLPLPDIKGRLGLHQALDFCHSRGIIHRDVKPMNIIVDHSKKVLKLIDWGLSEFYVPDKEYNVRVASRPFKGPELLVGFQKYDYSLDIWSTGCIFGSMVSRRLNRYSKRTTCFWGRITWTSL